MAKRRKVKGLTIRQATPSDDSDREEGTSQSRVYVRNVHFQVGATGALSTHTSYLASQASPLKDRPPHDPEIVWIETSTHEEEASDSRDPAYVEHIMDTSLDVFSRQRTRSDWPLSQWKPFVDEFLGEMIRLDGRDDGEQTSCHRCAGDGGNFCCLDCFGEDMLCATCMVNSHGRRPFHRIQEWVGTYFKRSSLKYLGLHVQLGHRVGDSCSNPRPAFGNDFVVIDVHGNHSVSLDYCGCEQATSLTNQLLRAKLFPATISNPKTAATFRCLETFHILSFESKASVFEYYNTLSRLTDNTGLVPLKDRYKSFLRMVREWRYLKMLKRAGRGHDATGATGTKPGELAVLCPACPQPGKNLPDGWENVPDDQAWRFALFLGGDANFRVVRRNVSSEIRDPSLVDGGAYFVQNSHYIAHLKENSDLPQEPSTCVSHNAVNNPDARDSRGLAATGVATFDCIRHDMKRPCSVGDLQKGERYVNMDYLFFSTLQFSPVLKLVVSYDVVCQWHKNLWHRMKIIPHTWHVDHEGRTSVVFLVPKFHLPAHIEYCHNNFSFNLTTGVGRTDGEGVERGWDHINPLATSTREMGPGSRRDTLDDHFGDRNWKKTIGLGTSLLRKIKTAVIGRSKHVVALEDLTKAIPESAVALWTAEVNAWEKDRSQPNPYFTRVETISLDKVRKTLAEAEATDLATGGIVLLHEEVSGSVLISSGLDLEAQQRRLKRDRAELGPHSTDRQHAKIRERSNALLRKIKNWMSVQLLYNPQVAILRRHEVAVAGIGAPALEPEDIQLWLPSAIDRQIVCESSLQNYEWQLRVAQANDALHEIRSGLRLRSHLWKFKNRFTRGQRANTRSQGVIDACQARIKASVQKYQIAHRALVTLSDILGFVGWRATLHELDEDRDVKGLTTSGFDEYDESMGRRELSWIWRVGNLATPGLEGEDQLQDALRIEWCRTRARALRFQEEVVTLQDEMHRTLIFFQWQSNWWQERGSEWLSSSLAPPQDRVHIGMLAYAERQAALRQGLYDLFKHTWRHVEQWVEQRGDETMGSADVHDVEESDEGDEDPFL